MLVMCPVTSGLGGQVDPRATEPRFVKPLTQSIVGTCQVSQEGFHIALTVFQNLLSLFKYLLNFILLVTHR